MTRTTLALRADVLKQIKRRAAERETTIQEIANELLTAALQASSRRPPFTLRLPAGWQSKARPGVDVADRDRLFDLLDGR